MVSPLAKYARVNRKMITVTHLHDRGSNVQFWRRQPAAKRLEGVELLRQAAHAYDPAAARVARNFIALPQLIRNKRASGRQKDLADVEALTIKRTRVRRTRRRRRRAS